MNKHLFKDCIYVYVCAAIECIVYDDLLSCWVHYAVGFIPLLYYTFLSVFMQMFGLQNVNQDYGETKYKKN